MIFLYSKWDEFCSKLNKMNITSVTAKDVLVRVNSQKFLILKHDVETNVKKALKMAKIESKYGHKGSFYVQAYLLEKKKNIKMLKEIASLGHEVSYHYDVMDSCKGNINKAVMEFEKNRHLFEENSFDVTTVCQHGNPIVERKGYTSNRDFFRNPKVKSMYSDIFDIMVDFKNKIGVEYMYFSDAGRHFQMIYDPLFNDVVDSEDKNIMYDDLDNLICSVDLLSNNCIISTHPHRWCESSMIYMLKLKIFTFLKKTAKKLVRIPIFNKLMNRYYYLAKKI